MKTTIVTLLITLTPMAAYAVPLNNIDDKYFSNTEPDLTPAEKEGLAIAKKWKAGAGRNIKPTTGADGGVATLHANNAKAGLDRLVCRYYNMYDIQK